jgi:hypothetical protein
MFGWSNGLIDSCAVSGDFGVRPIARKSAAVWTPSASITAFTMESTSISSKRPDDASSCCTPIDLACISEIEILGEIDTRTALD